MTFKARMGIICSRAAVVSQFLNQPVRMGLYGSEPITRENYVYIKKVVEKELEIIKSQLHIMCFSED